MTGMDPAVEAVEAELRRREKQRDPGWSVLICESCGEESCSEEADQ